jgi:hypothetical protein
VSDTPPEISPAAKDSPPPAPVRRAIAAPVKFAHPLAHYAAAFGKSERTLKNYIAAGRDAEPPSLPPFDEPWRMEAWWTTHMTNRCPAIFRELAAQGDTPVAAPARPATPLDDLPMFAPPAAPSSNAAGGATTPAAPIERGFLAALQRLRRIEAEQSTLHLTLLTSAHHTADAALQVRLSAEARQVGNDIEKIRSELRRYEAEAPKILTAAGDTWIRSEVVAAWELIHLSIAEGVRTLLRRVRPKLAACSSLADQDALWAHETERLFNALRSSRFAALPALDGPDAEPPTVPAPHEPAA